MTQKSHFFPHYDRFLMGYITRVYNRKYSVIRNVNKIIETANLNSRDPLQSSSIERIMP